MAQAPRTTARPSDEEIDFIRDFAPELSAGSAVTGELRTAFLQKKMDLRAAGKARHG